MALTDNARFKLNIAAVDNSVGDELQTKVFDKTAANTVSGVTTFSSIPIQSAQAVYCTADKTYASDTTLATVTGLSVTLVAAGIYGFKSVLRVTASANGGVKLALGGTATATGVIAYATNYNTTTLNINEVVTALDTAFGDATAACTHAVIAGTIEVNAAGTFTIDAAQNASHADTTTIHKYSSLEVIRLA